MAAVDDGRGGIEAPAPTRPSRVRNWRWWVGGLGKTLITVGLLMFGFVAYQLWGTGIETARAQNALESEFEELLSTTVPAPTTVAEPAPDATGPDTTAPQTAVPDEPPEAPTQNLPAVEEGDPIARIEMPTIGVDKIVVAGVSTSDLKKGPGHFPETPMPGQLGNAAIAGHRTTYGQPFFDVDKLVPGDEVVLTTPAGRFVYRVTGTQIVSPSDYWVVATTDPDTATLTLTSCDPKWTARDRIVVSADFDAAASSAPAGRAVIDYGRSDVDEAPAEDTPATLPGEPDTSVPEPSTSEPAVDPGAPTTGADQQAIADAFAEGWFSDPAAWPHVALWGLALAAIAVGGIALGRRIGRRWVGWLAASLPFVVCLYFFYQNVNRLLPPNL